MSNDINDLRDELFATIRALRASTDPMPIDRAKAISEVAQTIINSAKVEVDMINAVGHTKIRRTGFIGSPALEPVGEQSNYVGTPIRGAIR